MKKNKITLNTKILEGQARFPTLVYSSFNDSFEVPFDLETAKKKFQNADSIVPNKYYPKIILDTTSVLTKEQWHNFINLLYRCNFWNLSPYERSLGLDGAEWILEGQMKEKYNFVTRWSPVGPFNECCTYLIKLSAAKNEEIY